MRLVIIFALMRRYMFLLLVLFAGLNTKAQTIDEDQLGA